MKIFPTVLLCLAVVFAERLEDKFEGDTCREENGSLWTCKKLSDCQTIQDKLISGSWATRTIDRCQYVFGTRDDVICCEPQTTTASPEPVVVDTPKTTTIAPSKVTTYSTGSKSRKICEKYAASVFVSEHGGPFGDKEVRRDTCYTVQSLVMNGNETDPTEFPHMALIGYGEKGPGTKWHCQGALISERFVISAAHCTNIDAFGPARWVRLGEHNLNSMEDDVNKIHPVDYEIIERLNHPRYTPSRHYHDIALYKMDREVEFNQYIRPICLHTDDHFPESYVIATGWERTEYHGRQSDILKKEELRIMSQKDCRLSYPVSHKLRRGIINKMFCSGGMGSKKDTCQLKSGAPVLNHLEEPYCMNTLVGITSLVTKCDEVHPGVYTKVSHYQPWIESIVWP